ncbi:MAG: helix-turn-helix transcriptional regulator, partial [Candidatus Heimdallarchaeota archaeon]|nr:helix-turn-helix transcriptional regulator [Candidatus Heimdallarchaeota archaeon]MCK4609759.1 helix-turn-helix transcriptional regulator [Candidatus Heimdallarchaeota archaeon]
MIISELAFESEWVLKAITNDIRRKILFLIDDYSFLTYTDLLRELDLSTGKLNFHLRQLTGLIDKKGEKTYIL